MNLYVCWGTFPVPWPRKGAQWRPSAHPCKRAHDALREAGYSPRVIKCYGFAGPARPDPPPEGSQTAERGELRPNLGARRRQRGQELQQHRLLGTCQRADLKSTEGEGFEPSVDLRPQRFSRPPDSTTLAPLQGTATLATGGECTPLRHGPGRTGPGCPPRSPRRRLPRARRRPSWRAASPRS